MHELFVTRTNESKKGFNLKFFTNLITLPFT